MRAGKADRFLVQAVTQNCECEAVGHQSISANPSSWHSWSRNTTDLDRAADGPCCCWNCRRLVQRREVHPRKRGHLVIQSLKLCRVVQRQDSELRCLLGSKEQKSGGIDIESCEGKDSWSWSCILECHTYFSTKTKFALSLGCNPLTASIIARWVVVAGANQHSLKDSERVPAQFNHFSIQFSDAKGVLCDGWVTAMT